MDILFEDNILAAAAEGSILVEEAVDEAGILAEEGSGVEEEEVVDNERVGVMGDLH